MHLAPPLERIDYLLIGHFSKDLLPDGSFQLGGTVAYGALTARALGLRVGVVSSFNEKDISLAPLHGIPVLMQPSEATTTFSNLETPRGRRQILHHRADNIDFSQIPSVWRRAAIIHLAPVIQEVEGQLPEGFSPALLALTPQGWMRSWNAAGEISPSKWSQRHASLKQAGAVVLSSEDVKGDEALIEDISLDTPVFVLTEGAEGARLYWNYDLRRFPAPSKKVIDTTGAGDIFATAFFIRLYSTRDPWEAARFATCLASCSVTRRGLESIPTEDEIQICQMEVL